MRSSRLPLRWVNFFPFVLAIFFFWAHAWIFRTEVWPSEILCLLLGIFVLVALAGQAVLRSSYNFALAISLLAIYVTYTPVQLGDPWEEHLRNLPASGLLGSSLLSHLVYKLIYNAGLPIAYVSSISGFLAAWIFFRISDEQVATKDANERALIRLCYLASGVHLIYFRSYVEVAMPSIPPAMVALLYLGRFVNSLRERDFIFALLAFTLACLFHGQHTFFFPALPIIAIVMLGWSQSKRWAKLVVLSVVIPAALTAFTVGGLNLFFEVTRGDITGGVNGRMLVPLSSLFYLVHWWQVLNILLIAAPLLPVAWVLVPSAVKRRAIPRNFLFCCTLYAFAYISLLSLWEFDLGFPMDYDLMTSACFPVLLVLSVAFLRLFRQAPIVAYTWLGMGILVSWRFTYLLLAQGR